MTRWALVAIVTLLFARGENEMGKRIIPSMLEVAYKLLREPVTPAAIVEPTQGPWKRNFNWGGTYNAAFPVSAGSEFPVFTAEEIPGPPRVQTIVLQRNPQSQSGANADFRAKIDYGVGAMSDSFLCDWTRGAQFSIAANWVRVSAVSYAPDGTDVYDPNIDGAPAKVIIGAGMAEGALAPAEPLTFTTPLEPISDGASEEYIAPDFARAVIVNSPNATIPSPSNIIVIPSSGGNPLARFTYEEIHAMPRGATLPGGTRSLLIFNNSGAIRSMSVIWILGL